ncbi:MAG: family oxidoreductase [Phenylobacterium sp.]|nr:family oxidoreductase [Phenylobacterium sp.]
MERIEGRTAFITGAAGGIGLAVAEALLAAGARVVIADRDEPELIRQAQRLGPNAAAFVLDVTDRDRWAEARRFVEARLGPLDILVNNAGIGPDLQPLADMAPATFDLLTAIKLNGTFNGVHTFAAGLRERGEGHIVNTASMAGLTASARLGAYTTAMFGIVGLSEVLRAEMEPHGVGVSVLCPGRVLTRLGETTQAITGAARPAQPAGGGASVSPSRSALEPAVVGEAVLEAIRANRLYIVTHGEYRDLVDQRCRRVVSAFDGVPQRG